ncbi:SWI/SNF-related matrix-associated actin-dependent regulator of chromatin subfamily A member 3-like 1 [Nymphaea thermarum]|nr:SWI/SNF-related matrix-associated actin-dependent regulator of chromatin subfamily A member 3-like 1 [Nymphaea thermarum]
MGRTRRNYLLAGWRLMKVKERGEVFRNVLTCYRTDERPEPLRGGILADEIGLGKTPMLISLSATNRHGTAVFTSLVEPELDEANDVDGERNGKVDKKALLRVGNGDLEAQLWEWEEHTKTGSLKVYLYHGQRAKAEEKLRKFDIVFTTYTEEFDNPTSPVKQMEQLRHLRVILDEACHEEFECEENEGSDALNSKRSGAVVLLICMRSWRSFSIKSYWKSLIHNPRVQNFRGTRAVSCACRYLRIIIVSFCHPFMVLSNLYDFCFSL